MNPLLSTTFVFKSELVKLKWRNLKIKTVHSRDESRNNRLDTRLVSLVCQKYRFSWRLKRFVSKRHILALKNYFINKISAMNKTSSAKPGTPSSKPEVSVGISETYTDMAGLSCKPTKRVFFLKTSKTGSTTVANIMARFAFKHNLDALLGFGFYNDKRLSTQKRVLRNSMKSYFWVNSQMEHYFSLAIIYHSVHKTATLGVTSSQSLVLICPSCI